MIADYFVIRQRTLNVPALYSTDGEHRYSNGVSLAALFALSLAILPNLPGFLVTVKLIDPHAVPAFFVSLYSYAWFVGFTIAFCLYLVLRRIFPRL